MILRPYQREAIDAAYAFLRENPGNPCIEIPTGGGKSAVLATICKEAVENWQGRVLCLSHVKELIEQVAATLATVWPTGDVGIYSAGLDRRDTQHAVICAGIQSVFRRAEELGRFDLVLIDEVHLLAPDGDSMYQTLLSDLRRINPDIRLIGLTATPYRLDSGLIYGDGKPLAAVCYRAHLRDLIGQGFLSNLRGKNGGHPDLAGVHKRGGDYIESELAAVMGTDALVSGAVAEMMRHGSDRQAWLVFCCGIAHAEMVRKKLNESGISVALVTGETPSAERAQIVADYKARKLRCLVNVAVFTTGFDAPHVDMVVMMRPTCSPGLYYQIVGRGLRKAEGKADCIILDLAGNIDEHGPVDRIKPPGEKKEGKGECPHRTCPQCAEVHAIAAKSCPCCGHVYPPPEKAKHGTTAGDATPLHEPKPARIVRLLDFDVKKHVKKGATDGDGTPRTVRVIYSWTMRDSVSEWICVEHSGFARQKAEKWWREIGGEESLETDAEAAAMQIAGHLRRAGLESVEIREGENGWPEVLRRIFREPGADAPETDYSQPNLDEEPPF